MKTILTIDDDACELDINSRVLTEAGYRVLSAEDGETGITRAIFSKPDLILLDIMMPGIDGYEVCRQLRENKRTSEIPILFKTCLNSVDAAIAGIASGIDDFIVKPCNHEELLARILVKINQTRGERLDSMIVLHPISLS